MHTQRLHCAIACCYQQTFLPLVRVGGNTVKTVMFDFSVTCMFTQASFPSGWGSPASIQQQYGLLLRHVPSQTAQLLCYRINFFRQGAIAEAHSTTALYTFLKQILCGLDNKICTYIRTDFPTWVRLPLEFGSGLEAFKSQMAGFARGTELRNAVKEGLSK